MAIMVRMNISVTDQLMHVTIKTIKLFFSCRPIFGSSYKIFDSPFYVTSGI